MKLNEKMYSVVSTGLFRTVQMENLRFADDSSIEKFVFILSILMQYSVEGVKTVQPF